MALFMKMDDVPIFAIYEFPDFPAMLLCILQKFTHLNSSAILGDHFPQINYDYRAGRTGFGRCNYPLVIQRSY